MRYAKTRAVAENLNPLRTWINAGTGAARFL
jgi:hypothetical protein